MKPAAMPPPPPPAQSLAQAVAAAAARHPEALALRCGDRAWSYRQWLDEALAAAAGLPADLPPVVALAGHASQLAVAAVACSAAGRALWPLDSADAGVGWPRCAALGGPAVARLESWPPSGLAGIPAAAGRDDLALVIGTSGSEGAPKAVMLSHGNLDAAAAASNRRLPLEPGDRWLDCLPLVHIGGLSILWRCFRAGAAVVLHERFEAAAVADDLVAGGITHISLVPAMLAALLDRHPAPPPSLRCALVGGAALARPLYERATAAGWPVYPTYGMSETAAQVATRLPDGTPWREGDVGLPLDGIDVAIGSDGRLRVRGPQVMLGYLNPALRPGFGVEDGWFAAGDLGRRDAAGRLVILGRADDMLISGGRNLHPAEIEAGLAGCPGLADVAVTGLPDPIWGDTVVALVVGPVSDATLQAWSRDHLPGVARPRRIVRLPALPRNAMGKLERPALRALAAGAHP